MTVKRLIRLALQIALFGFVCWYVYIHWSDYEHVFQKAHPDWAMLGYSSFIVFVAYVVLIQTWRQTVIAFGERLDFWSATRIWFVSNLGKYVPGKVWSIAAMGTLAQERGVSPVAAMGSSIVVQVVNLVTGLAVFAVAGAHTMKLPNTVVVVVVALGLGMLGAPWVLPGLIRVVSRLTGRAFTLPMLPHSAIWWAAAGTTLAWVFYGVAFEAFAIGMGAGSSGSVGDWTAIFIGPYLLGFIAVFAPGGIGVREVAMAEALQRTGLAAGALAALLVAASRVWLTVLEIIPGVVWLLLQPLSRSPSSRT
jgi:glycosyltransferase 2 family protein